MQTGTALQSEFNQRLGLGEDHDEKQYLTFLMAGEEYGVDILSVQEIRGWTSATAIPNAPDFVKGAINLRGTIVPIIDLRLRFGIDPIAYGPLTVVIVVAVEFKEQTKTMGIVVDGVSDVYSISEEKAKDVPDFQESSSSQYVDGLVNVGEKMVVLLNLQKTLQI
ncbi:Positive regulator of CheA protein activity (CheW) [Pseudoalteromonas luteoviolacea B = ATCC 29581]|nr:Positive regulator of CheA protein activity (CheW) [Pseudoalteromonas luteoviolacea B = ATCC 29581]